MNFGGDSLALVAPTTFAAEGVKERAHLQRLLRERIDSLEGGLMVLTDEFDGWADSLRRIDLLCLDTDANLVVVELKRDEDGGHMELQAIRYAAMVSQMTFDQAVGTLARHRSRSAPDTDAARADILAFLNWPTADENLFARDTRIILAAADFGKEITTAVLWLREHDIDIRCIRLKPYRLEEGRLLVDIQQIIPLPEAAEFQTRIEEKKAAERKEKGERASLLERFFDQLSSRAAQRTHLHAERTPDLGVGALFGAIGRAGFSINYVITKQRSRVELLIHREDARQQLLKLKEAEAVIEEAFRGALIWQEQEGVRQCRVYHSVEGGYRSTEDAWPEIQDALIDAMIRLEAAFRPRVAALG